MIFKPQKFLEKLSLSLIFVSANALATTKSSDALKQVTERYRASSMVEMSVDKVIKSDLLGREIVYTGKIFLAGGKFRWENKTPDETLLVFDGANIWSVQMPPKEFGGSTQIAKGVVNKKNKSQILIATLLGNESVNKNFKVLKEEKTNGFLKLEVAPRGNDLTVKSLTLVLDPKEKIMKELSYMDDVGNLTTMKFSKVIFKKKLDKTKFQYKPPKGAQVTEL